MKKTLSLIFCALVCIAPATSFASPAKEAAVVTLMDTVNYEKLVNDSIETSLSVVEPNRPISDKLKNELNAFYSKYVGPDVMREKVIELLANEYSTQEIEGFIANYKPITGKENFNELPAYMQIVVKHMRAQVGAHQDELFKILSGQTKDYSHVETAQREAILELLEMLDYDKLPEMAVKRLINSHPEMAKYEDKMRAFYEKYLGPDSIREDMIQIYAEAFTTEELLALAAHYRTPAGKKAVKLMPQLMQKGGELGQKKVTNHIGELHEIFAQ